VDIKDIADSGEWHEDRLTAVPPYSVPVI